MRTTRKILLALVLTLCVAAVLSVCAFAAYNLDVDLPEGAVKGDAKWVDSGYADIDAEGSGWVMIGGAIDYSGTTEKYPTIAKADAGRFYWNKETDKGVYVVTSGDLNANWQDWTLVSAATATKKRYAFAAAFVDEMFGYYGKGAYQSALGGDVAATKEASVYVNGSALSSYTVFKRYVNDYKKASTQWTNFAVTKASYDSFVTKRAELEAAGMTGTELEDALVEFVYENFSSYKMSRNVKENGSYVMLTWVWYELANAGYVFDTFEFRATKNNTVFSTFGLALQAAEVKTVLFDSKITGLKLSDVSRGMAMGVANLKTLGHVSFNSDGTYAGTVTENVVDLRGFETAIAYGDSLHCSHMFQSASGIKEVIWFNTMTVGGANKTGVVDTAVFRYCSGLEKITFNAPLTSIGSNTFGGCTSLAVIDLKGGVAAGATVDAAAFTSATQDIVVYVYSAADQSKANALFAAFGNITVENKSVSEAAITADGYSIRYDDTNAITKGPALRAEFTLLKSKIDLVKSQEGYDLADYGVVVFSENTFNTYGSIDAIIAAIQGGLDETAQKKIKVVSAASGPWVRKNNETGDVTFAAAITGIGDANYDSAIYTYAYAAWSNGSEVKYTYTTYVSTRVAGKSAHSLYDAAVFAFANGVVNSQNFVMSTGVKLWDILSKGAWSVTEADVKAPAAYLTLTQGFEYDENGEFTYLDLPLRAWNMYKKNGAVQWNSMGVDVEAESTTNILWSILRDGDNLVVVYRPKSDATATLPKLSDSYGASAPYSSFYFTPKDAKESNVTADPTANGLLKTAILYSPILTADNAKRVQTIVIDYGVDAFGDQSLDDSKKSNAISTIVYPEGMTSTKYLLAGCYALENFIYVTADKSYLSEYNVDTLVDLTGIANLSDYGITQAAASIKNLLLPEKIKNSQQYGFTGAKSLERVWTVGYDMPEAGVMDLSQTSITTICKGYFNNLDNITDVIMPDTFKAISAYSMATKNQTTDTARWFIFGNNKTETKLNIHVGNWDALNVIANTFYEARQNIEYNDNKAGDPNGIAHVVDYLKITYNGETKTVLEWRADFPAKPE